MDGIHFILSLANEHNFKLSIPKEFSIQQGDVTEQFLLLYEGISKFQHEITLEAFQTVFTEYLRLGKMFGFSAAVVEKAYVTKNEVKYERQKQGIKKRNGT